jgi:hypothetical protein
MLGTEKYYYYSVTPETKRSQKTINLTCASFLENKIPYRCAFRIMGTFIISHNADKTKTCFDSEVEKCL